MIDVFVIIPIYHFSRNNFMKQELLAVCSYKGRRSKFSPFIETLSMSQILKTAKWNSIGLH